MYSLDSFQWAQPYVSTIIQWDEYTNDPELIDTGKDQKLVWFTRSAILNTNALYSFRCSVYNVSIIETKIT